MAQTVNLYLTEYSRWQSLRTGAELLEVALNDKSQWLALWPQHQPNAPFTSRQWLPRELCLGCTKKVRHHAAISLPNLRHSLRGLAT